MPANRQYSLAHYPTTHWCIAVYYPCMNAFTGSLQCKGRRYYLVLTSHGQQKWIALKTGNVRIARYRAAQLAPFNADNEMSWLVHLIRLGDKARSRLAKVRKAPPIPWRQLYAAFRENVLQRIPSASEPSYRRWIDILAESAPAASSPASLSADDARLIAEMLCARYVSARRMIVFYRRVWRVMDFDVSVWSLDGSLVRGWLKGCRSEFYRRLETDEVRMVVRHLMKGRCANSCAYADMVLIGYYTGLRLSDVAELERDEVSRDGRFIVLKPNKTSHIRRRPIRVPLTGFAYKCVERLMSRVGGDGFLFPRGCRHPSKAICRAFRDCGVMKRGNGRASFHSLRATFISLMDEAGVPPHITDAITGHADGGMHARYTQPSDAALMAAVSHAIPPLWKMPLEGG